MLRKAYAAQKKLAPTSRLGLLLFRLWRLSFAVFFSRSSGVEPLLKDCSGHGKVVGANGRFWHNTDVRGFSMIGPLNSTKRTSAPLRADLWVDTRHIICANGNASRSPLAMRTMPARLFRRGRGQQGSHLLRSPVPFASERRTRHEARTGQEVAQAKRHRIFAG